METFLVLMGLGTTICFLSGRTVAIETYIRVDLLEFKLVFLYLTFKSLQKCSIEKSNLVKRHLPVRMDLPVFAFEVFRY